MLREDTLARESMTQAECRWLRTHRPAAAEHLELGDRPAQTTCPMPRQLQEPWRAFLLDLDSLVDHQVQLHCCGRFVVTTLHGLPRATADLDIISVVPQDDMRAPLPEPDRTQRCTRSTASTLTS